MDQERMRVLLSSRWMDKACQIIHRGWHAALELRRAAERKLEVSVRGLDAARRGDHKDRLMLNEFQRESWNLQLEMREDVARLNDRLAESESQADVLSADLAAGRAVFSAGKAKADQGRLQSEEQLAEAERKIKAMRVEEIELKDALGRSQAEETRLCGEVSDNRNKCMTAEVLADLTEVCRLNAQKQG